MQTKIELYDTLEKIANGSDVQKRRNIAKNCDAPTKILGVLSTDSDAIVRCYVAQNIKTSPELLKILATDSDVCVRRYVAQNIKTPPEQLKILATDSNITDDEVSLIKQLLQFENKISCDKCMKGDSLI